MGPFLGLGDFTNHSPTLRQSFQGTSSRVSFATMGNCSLKKKSIHVHAECVFGRSYCWMISQTQREPQTMRGQQLSQSAAAPFGMSSSICTAAAWTDQAKVCWRRAVRTASSRPSERSSVCKSLYLCRQMLECRKQVLNWGATVGFVCGKPAHCHLGSSASLALALQC